MTARLGPAEDLLFTVAQYRCVSADQARRLLGWSRYQTSERLRRLVAQGLLSPYVLPRTTRRAYYLGSRAFSVVPRLKSAYGRSICEPSAATALWGWQRAEAVAYFGAIGLRVERDYLALRALRADLLLRLEYKPLRDALLTHPALRDHRASNGAIIWEPFRCRRCGYVADKPEPRHIKSLSAKACTGRMYRSSYALFDIVHSLDDCEPPFILLVDNPNRSVSAQLRELPTTLSAYDRIARTIRYQPKARVLFLPSDDGSIWDPRKRRWLLKGPRLRTFESLTRSTRRRDFEEMPFHRTVEPVHPPSIFIRQAIPQPNGEQS